MSRHRYWILAGAAALSFGLALGCGPGERSPDAADGAAVEESQSEQVATRPRKPERVIDVEGSASLGPANAPVTLVEYSDFQ